MRQFFAPEEPRRQAIPANFREEWPEINETVQITTYTECFGEMNEGLHELHQLVQGMENPEKRLRLVNHLMHIRGHLVMRLDEMWVDKVLRDN